MGFPAEVLEDELFEAITKKDKQAIKHFVMIITENIESKENKDAAEKRNAELLIKLKEIEVTIKEGFKAFEKRFEQIDKRFEQVDKRFEQVDKRFEEMIHYMDRRFEDVDKRFSMMFKFMSIGYTVITALIVLFKFLK